MTLLIDSNEVRNQPQLVSLVSQSIDIDKGSFNETGGSSLIYPDYTVFGAPKMVGANRKTVTEVAGNLDSVVEQLLRELAGPVEQLALIVEGIMVPDGQSGTWTYSVDWGNARLYPRTDQRGDVPFRRQHFYTNYEHIQNTLVRLEWAGIQIIPSYSTIDTAGKLVSLHKLAMIGESNKVLDRLIKKDIAVLALDPEEKAFAETLMGVRGANWGEELALTVAALGFQTIGDLFKFWDEGSLLCDTMLRGGTRRIGNAAERKLQTALGWTNSSGPGPELSRLSSAESPVSYPQEV